MLCVAAWVWFCLSTEFVERVAIDRCGYRYVYAYIQQSGDSRTAKLWARACSSTPLACEDASDKNVSAIHI